MLRNAPKDAVTTQGVWTGEMLVRIGALSPSIDPGAQRVCRREHVDTIATRWFEAGDISLCFRAGARARNELQGSGIHSIQIILAHRELRLKI